MVGSLQRSPSWNAPWDVLTTNLCSSKRVQSMPTCCSVAFNTSPKCQAVEVWRSPGYWGRFVCTNVAGLSLDINIEITGVVVKEWIHHLLNCR